MPPDAFISYSHAADHALARQLERGLERVAKPWYKRRALDVFRDEGNLNLSAHLWGSIQAALDSSRFFIYLASPAAAGSPWVTREIAHWRAHREMARFIIVVTDGTLVWDAQQRNFNAAQSTAIPEVLRGAFADEPFYLDMRWARNVEELALDHDRFRDQIVRIAAAIRDVSVEDLTGEDAEQHRRTIRIRNLAIAGLATLTVAASAAAIVAFQQRSAAQRSEAFAKTQQTNAERSADAERRSASEAERRRQQAEVAEALATARAEEAALQRSIAEREAHAARVALSQASTQEATRLMESKEPRQALAFLARALVSDPSSLAARSWVSDLILNQGLWVAGATLPHQGTVYSAAFSPDGRRVFTAADDKTARVWDVATGRAIGEPIRLPDNVDATFSPDGQLMVAVPSDPMRRVEHGLFLGSVPSRDYMSRVDKLLTAKTYRESGAADHVARLLSVSTRQAVGPPLHHKDVVNAAAFSADGRRIVTASDDHTARIWEVNTGQLVATLQHDAEVLLAEFSGDSRRILTKTVGGEFWIWDTASGRRINVPLQHKTRVENAAASPDGRLVLTVYIDDTVQIWEAATGRAVGRAIPVQDIVDAAFSPDGGRIVTTSLDDVRVWDATTGQSIAAADDEADSSFRTASFSPDGRHIITLSFDNAVRIWNATTGHLVGTAILHSAPVFTARFSPDGRRIVTTSFDHTARIWDAPIEGANGLTTAPTMDRTIAFSAGGHEEAPSHDGRSIVRFDSGKSEVRITDAVTRKLLGGPFPHRWFVSSATMSPDGRRVVTLPESKLNTAQVWDVTTGQPIGTPLQHKNPVRSALFSPDGRRVVTAANDSTARIWDASTGRPLGPPLQHDGVVTLAVFSPDGQRVATASNDSTARVWVAATGRALTPPLRHQEIVNAVAFSNDGRRVVTGSGDRTARVWDAATGHPVGVPLTHQSSVLEAVFSPDGRLVATLGNDKTARVWDSETGKPVGRPLWLSEHSATISFSREGRHVLVLSGKSIQTFTVLLDLDSTDRVERLADLAELMAGGRVSNLGSFVALDSAERQQRVRRLVGSDAPLFPPVEVLLRAITGRWR